MSLQEMSHSISLENIAPSDFKDLLDAALHLYAESACFLQESSVFPASTHENGAQSSEEGFMIIHRMTTAKALVKRHQELDTYYGWALASDRSCVDRALRSIRKADAEPMEWFKEIVNNLGSMYLALKHFVEDEEKPVSLKNPA